MPAWALLNSWPLLSWNSGMLTAAHGWARLFLHSVASALLGVLLLVLVATYVFVEFFVNPMQLRTNQHFEGQFGFQAHTPTIPKVFCGYWSQIWLSTVFLCLAVLKNHTDLWFVFLPAAPVETQAPAILALAALLILLGLLSTALLGHLLCFHIYLSKCYLTYLPTTCLDYRVVPP